MTQNFFVSRERLKLAGKEVADSRLIMGRYIPVKPRGAGCNRLAVSCPASIDHTLHWQVFNTEQEKELRDS